MKNLKNYLMKIIITFIKEFKQKNIFESKVKHLKKQEDLRNFSKLLE